jgi:nitric oxide reductase NorE protein
MSEANFIKKGSHVPVEPAFWTLVFGDLLVFGAMFILFIVRRFESSETYQAFIDGSHSLNQGVGFANTLILLTSSFFVARAVTLFRGGKILLAEKELVIGLIFSLGFVALKAYEYFEKVSSGIGVTTSRFYEFYFTFTGIHLLHVVIGAALITYLITRCRAERQGTEGCGLGMFEGVACYWHMVDLLWLILFSLFYLIP